MTKYFIAEVGLSNGRTAYIIRERRGGWSIPANGGKRYRTYEQAAAAMENISN